MASQSGGKENLESRNTVDNGGKVKAGGGYERNLHFFKWVH